MATILDRIRRRSDVEQRYTIDDYIGWVQDFYFNGINYGLTGVATTLASEGEQAPVNFTQRVQAAYARNGVVFACQAARSLIFTEARLVWQAITEDGRPGDYFLNPALDIVDRPWPGASASDLLSRMLQDVDLAGNFYGRRVITNMEGVQIERLRPDWVVILVGRRPGLTTDTVVGYLYYPSGLNGPEEPVRLEVDEVVHWAPYPDPLGVARGMSWLTPVIRDITADLAAMKYRLKYYEQGAVPSVIVSYDASFTLDQFERMVAFLEGNNAGPDNAYKIMHLAGGADATVVGSSPEQQDFKNIMGHGETRICAAARVPPVIVGLSEGLQAATYSNYGQARRHFADSWARPYWRSACQALEPIITPRPRRRARLWYDDRDISFLQEDLKDAAEIQGVRVATITKAIRDGFTAESAKAAVINDDLSLLEHSGFLSVQLQPDTPDEIDDGEQPAVGAGDQDDDEEPVASSNGSSPS